MAVKALRKLPSRVGSVYSEIVTRKGTPPGGRRLITEQRASACTFASAKPGLAAAVPFSATFALAQAANHHHTRRVRPIIVGHRCSLGERWDRVAAIGPTASEQAGRDRLDTVCVGTKPCFSDTVLGRLGESSACARALERRGPTGLEDDASGIALANADPYLSPI